MKTLHTFALAAGAPLALLAGLAPSASAATPTTTTTPPGDGATADVPADWQVLVDDTQLLTLAAPPDWTDLDLVPGANPDGSPRPWLEASPDIASFHETFDTPGVLYVALPASNDLHATLETFDVGDCGSETVEDYDDGAFVGVLIHQTRCGSDGNAQYFKLAANNPVRPDLTIMIQIGITDSADRAIADTILSSFNFTPQPANPGGSLPVTVAPTVAPSTTAAIAAPPVTTTASGGATTVAGAPPTALGVPTTAIGAPTTASPTSTVAGGYSPNGSIAPDAVRVVDDTGSISVSVPADWSEHITTPRNEGAIPAVAASPDQASFQPGEGETDTFSTPGVIYLATPFQSDTESVLAGFTDGQMCADAGVQPYHDGVFTGHIQEFTDCGGTATRVFVVAANPADRAFTAVVLVQLTTAGDAELQTVLSSFNYDAAAIGNLATAASTTTVG